MFFSCIACQLLYSQQISGNARPNIIIILADDLGYGDLGIYGGDVPVPNLARMAREGLRFTDFHSNGAVCSPTRAALLTGRYQQRMGIEKALGEDEKGLGDEKAKQEITIAKYLRDTGYATGIIGKWHLGYTVEQSPVNYGFDEFWGTLHGAGDYHSRINTFGRYDWWHNKDTVKEKGYSTDLITQHAIDFMKDHRKGPFFLFVSHKAIHFPWQTPGDTAFRKEGFKYRDVQGPLNRLGQHSPQESREVIRQMIIEMDKSVGEILAALRKLKLDKNTLVLFCSDNGGIVQYRGGYTNISSNQPFRGEKGDVYEGGQRVPAIAWWPGKIRQGKVSNATLMTMDLAPTFLELARTKLPSATGPNRLDGISISSLLFDGQESAARKLFWKAGNSCAVRYGKWKLVVNGMNARPELYNLENDKTESKDLSAAEPGLVKELAADLEKWKQDVYSKNKP